MSRIIIILLLNLVISTSHAQNYKLSEEISLSSYKAFDGLGFFGDQFLSILISDSKAKLHGYDQNLQKTWDKDLEFDYKQTSFVAVTRYNDSFFLFYKCKNKRLYEMRVHEYDGHGELKDSTALYQNPKSDFLFNYKTTFSKDKSKLLIYDHLLTGKTKLIAFDFKTKTIIYNKEIQIKNLKLKSDDLTYLITNDGDSFVLHNKNNVYYKREDHKLFVYKISQADEIVSNYELSDYAFKDFKYVYDENNRQLVLGSINIQERRAPYQLMISYINENTKSIKRPISLGNLALLRSDKENKGRKIMDDLEIEDLILRRDGGVVILLEKVFIQKSVQSIPSTINPNRNMGSYTNYYNEDILIFNINPDGTVLWKNRMKKKQNSDNDGALFSSGYVKLGKKQMNFFYNDEIKTDTKVFSYNITADGNIRRSLVYNTKNKDLLLRWNDAYQLNKNQLIVPSQHRKKLRFLIIDFSN